MTVNEMIQKIQEAIRLSKPDATYLDFVLLGDLNQVLDEVTAENCLLELETTDSISFDSPEEFLEEDGIAYLQAALPDDYHHDLYEAYNVTAKRPVRIHANRKSLYRYFADGNRTGDYIGNVAVQGPYLLALPIIGDAMDEEIISIGYYKQADDLELDGAGPSCVPSHLHYGLLVSGVLRRKLLALNPGMAQVHEQRYAAGLLSLGAFVKTPSRKTPFIKRYARYF